MTRVVLSLGSNLGDRLSHLRSVVDRLGDRVVAVSDVWVTAPWGGVQQSEFWNAVVIAQDSQCDCDDWLPLVRELEKAAGRKREVHWGPRTLDVDIIWCGLPVAGGMLAILNRDPELTLPHPHAHERAFVLVPWLQIEPDATLPIRGAPRAVAELVARLPESERASVRRLPPSVASLHNAGKTARQGGSR